MKAVIFTSYFPPKAPVKGMRFVSIIAIAGLTLLGSTVEAQDNRGLSITRAAQASPMAEQSARQMPRGISAVPQTRAGFYAVQMAANLGTISAIDMDEDGTVYALNPEKGVVYALPDRGQDGRPDGRQRYIDGFNTPSGLAVSGGTLYISDSNAVWVIDLKTRRRRQVSSLRNTKADITPRPLAAVNGKVILGFNTLEGADAKAHIVAIDPETGRADALHQSADGPITTLTAQSSGQIWAGIGTQLVPIGMNGLAFPVLGGAPIMGITFAPKESLPSNWPSTLGGAMYLSLGQGHKKSRGSYSVITLSSAFGAPAQDVDILAEGFYNPRTHQIWGQPTTMMMTRHGLIIADRLGRLWRIAVDDRPVKAAKKPVKTPLPDAPQQKPSQPRGTTVPMVGSQLGKSASGINTGTSIKVGSTLIKKYEAEQAEKEKAEKEAEEAKRVKNKTAK